MVSFSDDKNFCSDSKLKAETGEWFYGLMRPELKRLQDGTTLVKEAVMVKPMHCKYRFARIPVVEGYLITLTCYVTVDKRTSPSLQQPEIVYTPATSTSRTSSRHGL